MFVYQDKDGEWRNSETGELVEHIMKSTPMTIVPELTKEEEDAIREAWQKAYLGPKSAGILKLSVDPLTARVKVADEFLDTFQCGTPLHVFDDEADEPTIIGGE